MYKAIPGQRCKYVKTSDSNLYVLLERDEDVAEIEFYYDKVEQVCLHLAENPVEAKQVMN